MLFTLLLMVTFSKEVQLLNAKSEILFAVISIVFKDEHEANALSPIAVTLFGITKDFNDLQPANVKLLILLISDLMLTSLSLRQPQNAPAPIVLTLEGSFTTASCEQSSNA